MLKKATLPLILLCSMMFTLTSATTALAQAKKGDSEVLLFGNVSMDPKNAGGSATGTFFFNYGAYATNHTQIGGGPLIAISNAGGSVDSTLGLNGFLRQYFGKTKVAPYVGGEVFMSDVQNSDSTFLNAIFGVKNYFSDRAAIDFKGAYGFAATAPAFGERPQMFQFSVGLTVIF